MLCFVSNWHDFFNLIFNGKFHVLSSIFADSLRSLLTPGHFWLWVQVLAPWALLVSFTSYLLKLFPLHLALILWFFAWQLSPKTFPQAVLFPVYVPHFWRFEVVKGGSYIATFQGPCLFLLWRLQIFSFPSLIPLILLGIIMTIILIIMTVNINRTYFVPGTSKALYTY